MTLTWSADPNAEAFSVYEYAEGKYQYIKMISGTEAVIANVSQGTHTYAVRPRKFENGAWVFGDYSNRVDVSVNAEN